MAGKDTKTRIKKIGLRLFQERGFENITINEICAESGINKHTFYYYFKSKDELLKDFYEFPHDISTEYFVQILNAENFMEQLWLSYNPFLEYVTKSGTEIARQLFIKNLNCDVGTFRMGHKHVAMLELQTDIITKGQKAGEIRNGSDPRMLCALIQQTCMSTAFAWVMTDGGFDFKTIVRAEMEVLLDTKPELRRAEKIDLREIWFHVRDSKHRGYDMDISRAHRHNHDESGR